MTKPQMPDWARHPDPSYVDTLERLRRRYAWGFDRQPLKISTAHGEDVLDMDTAIAWANIRAGEELG